MHAYSNEATQLFEPGAGATRWSWRRGRIASGMRSAGRAVASGMTRISAGLLRALHETRSRSAARMIHQHRYLIQDDDCADDAGLQTRQSGLAER
jgi:hypothetical protein